MYQELVRSINQSMNRKVITVERLRALIAKAKEIRRTQGVGALIEYAGKLPQQFLSQQEVEQLQRSSEYPVISNQLIDLLASEKVISPFEAMMLRRYI